MGQGIQMHENRKKKLPDRLADSCKRSSANRMAAGSRFFFSFFSNTFVQLTKPTQAFVRPTGIQALPSPIYSIIRTWNKVMNQEGCPYLKICLVPNSFFNHLMSSSNHQSIYVWLKSNPVLSIVLAGVIVHLVLCLCKFDYLLAWSHE